MFVQAALLPEVFPTGGTGEGLLSSVNPHVVGDMDLLGENFPTDKTGERFHATVSLLVIGQVAGVAEGLPALIADKRFLAGVDPLVFGQVAVLGKTFPTNGTGIQISICVLWQKVQSVAGSSGFLWL